MTNAFVSALYVAFLALRAAPICSVQLRIHFVGFVCSNSATHSFRWIYPSTVMDLYVKDGSTFWPGKRELGIHTFFVKLLPEPLMEL